MTEWREVTLSEVCSSVDYGYTASSSLEPVGPRFLRITDIAGSSLNWAEVPHCEIDNESFEKFRLVHGDIVVARTGATVGHGRWVSPPEPSVFASYLVRFRPSDDVNARFIGHVVESSTYKEFVKRSAGGAAQPNANAKVLGSFPLRLPDRASQDRIVSLVQPIDDLIESNQRRIALLEQMAQAIYREWFVHFRYPGPEYDEFVDSASGPIPAGWEASPISEVVEVLGGGTPSKAEPDYWDDGSITWYTPSDLTKAKSMFMYESANQITPEGLARSSATLFPPGSVLMTSRATLGVVAISTIEACTNQGFIVCVPNERLSALHLYFWLRENEVELEALGTGATFKEITRGAFRRVPIAIPPVEIERAFRKSAAPIGEQVETLSRFNMTLRRLRDLLLPRLVTGAIDVSKLDLDALLEDSAS